MNFTMSHLKVLGGMSFNGRWISKHQLFKKDGYGNGHKNTVQKYMHIFGKKKQKYMDNFFSNLELFRENEHKTRDMKILYCKKGMNRLLDGLLRSKLLNVHEHKQDT